ncbi:MAG: PKD domain-containing protein, partial [Bacteroidia bacterium]|nr:PKD domain-containing protein [Bacteroidia bacterium]
NTTVFVARTEVVTAGKTNSADLGTYTTDFAFLRFDAELPFRLKSVQVYSQGDGNRRFQLRTSTGTILKDTTIFLNFGPRTVVLDMDVPAGVGHELGVNSGQVRLLTTTEGVAYPYVSEIVVSITGSTLGATSYPYLFDWEIAYEGCRQPVPVEVVAGDIEVMISPKDTAIYLALGGEISFSNSSQTITNATWTWGDGSSSTGSAATHIYDSAGVYSVYLTAESQNGCAGSDSARVTVLDWALSGGRYGSGWTIEIYPNPAKDRLILSWQALPAKEMSIELFDLQGKALYRETIRPVGGSWPLDLSSVSPGSYVLKCVSGTDQCIHRIQVNP